MDNLKNNKEKIVEPPFNNNTGFPKDGKDSPIPSDRFYTEKEEVTLRFYQTPKALFNNPRYKGLSLGSKLMYSILRDRLDMSIENKWKDEKGYIYLVFSVEELASILEIDRKAVMRYKKLLVDYKLIIDKRLGQGRSNMIYVLKPELFDNQKSQKGTSRSPKSVLPEVQNKDTNDTYLKKTDLNNVNGASREEVVENSTVEIVELNAETNEDINDIRRKIKKSLKESEKFNFIKPQDFGKGKNNYQKDWNLKDNKKGKNTKSKRYWLAENEAFVQEIAEALRDDHSLGAFRVIVDKIPKQQIRIFLSIIKDTYLTGRIKKSRGAMFISLAKEYTRENNINLNFK
ncbi:MAG: replication initiator protein A [Candidatus Humimicrobiaceae bacterium]